MLIPKTPNPTNLVNFRPISLCTVLYKIVTKTIANRLQNYIGRCIDSAQSAFVPGRLISDNVLIAYEILHTLRKSVLGKKVREGVLKGVKASKRGQTISHLLFADDCILFGEATKE
ncbi:LINE-1 reverse transcriptase isogeny [Gossypium australe]|uniref:LINE-1 reverse transcriptase isogeny n=1 Tax=Gossypium australe TaxID=47621 RepID=A0A5B6W6P4_9ROSI|nr:LINE-1 reverse transcriptase isogeny [Gossypium australe]